MEIFIFLQGIILGILVSTPIGPIAIISINRTINKNFVSGFVSGIGATTADIIYCIMALFSLSYLTEFLTSQKFLLDILCFLMLFAFGLHTIFSNNQSNNTNNKQSNKVFFKDYLSTFILTVANPANFIFFLFIFAWMDLSISFNSIDGLLILMGLGIGSILWWSFINIMALILKQKMNYKFLGNINVISGAIICFIGVYMLLKIIWEVETMII